MSYATSKHIAASDIPIIDIAPLHDGDMSGVLQVAQALREAAETVGFFYVKEHAIPAHVIAQAHAASRAFFALPLECKRDIAVNHHHHGFLRVGEAKMYDTANTDLKESFVWGLDRPDGHPDLTAENPFLGRNQWPQQPSEMRSALYRFFELGLRCAQDLMRAFAVSMGLDDKTFIQRSDKPIARGSTIYYPPQPARLGREQFGVAPHTDFGVLTLLWQDQTGGLEVLNKAGDWVTAHPIPDTLVVNVGDLLARWTNDSFNSTMHRVINRSGKERYSMVIAWDPNFETVIEPVCQRGEAAHYEPILCGEYVLNRFDRAFAYRNHGP